MTDLATASFSTPSLLLSATVPKLYHCSCCAGMNRSGTKWVSRCQYWVKVVTYAAVIFLCRKPCAVGKSMIYMSFLLDESIVCGIDFSNTLQGHTCF